MWNNWRIELKYLSNHVPPQISISLYEYQPVPIHRTDFYCISSSGNTYNTESLYVCLYLYIYVYKYMHTYLFIIYMYVCVCGHVRMYKSCALIFTFSWKQKNSLNEAFVCVKMEIIIAELAGHKLNSVFCTMCVCVCVFFLSFCLFKFERGWIILWCCLQNN